MEKEKIAEGSLNVPVGPSLGRFDSPKGIFHFPLVIRGKTF